MLTSLKLLLSLPASLWLLVVCHLPGQPGFAIRRWYWRKRLRHLGRNVLIGTGVQFQNPDYIAIDDNSWVDNNVTILAGLDKSDREKIRLPNKNYRGMPAVVHIGKNVHVGPRSLISGISSGVYISDDCGFSANCNVFAFSHHYRSKSNPADTRIHFGPMVPWNRQCIVEGSVFMGKNTGVALGSTILPGTSIPENCFVAINSVVAPGRFSPNSIIDGNPAKSVGKRFNSDE